MTALIKSALHPTSALDAQTAEFYDSIIDLFTGLREGHLGRYCFSSAHNELDLVRGDQHWAQFIKTSTAYYPYHHQIEIIRKHAKHIGQLVSDAETFVDLGTGSLNSFEHKILPIMRSSNFNKILFVDLCDSFSKVATERLKQEKLSVKTQSYVGNFFNQLPVFEEKAVINLFGITLGNIIVDLPREEPQARLAETFKHFAKPLAKKGGYFIFDYDTNDNPATIHASYEHAAYHAMEMTIFERVKRDLPTLDFYPDDFEHITAWYPQWNLLAQELRAKIDLRFVVGDYKVDLQKGKSFRTGSSFKYSDKTIENAALQAGFEKVEILSNPGSPMRVAIYRIIV